MPKTTIDTFTPEEKLKQQTGLGEEVIVRISNEAGMTYRETRHALMLWEEAKSQQEP